MCYNQLWWLPTYYAHLLLRLESFHPAGKETGWILFIADEFDQMDRSRGQTPCSFSQMEMSDKSLLLLWDEISRGGKPETSREVGSLNSIFSLEAYSSPSFFSSPLSSPSSFSFFFSLSHKTTLSKTTLGLGFLSLNFPATWKKIFSLLAFDISASHGFFLLIYLDYCFYSISFNLFSYSLPFFLPFSTLYF